MSNDASKKKCLRCYALGIECSGGESGYPCWQCRNAPAYGPTSTRAERKSYFLKERLWIHTPLAADDNKVQTLTIHNRDGKEERLLTNSWPARVCEAYGNAFSFLFLFNSMFTGKRRLDVFANIILLLELRHGVLTAADPNAAPLGVPVPPDFVPTDEDEEAFQALRRTGGLNVAVTEDVKRKLTYIIHLTAYTGEDPIDLDIDKLPPPLGGYPLFAGADRKGVTNLIDDLIPNKRYTPRPLPYTLVVAASGQRGKWVIGPQAQLITPIVVARPVQPDPSRLPRRRQPSPPAAPAPWAPDPAVLAAPVRAAYNAENPQGSIATDDHMAAVLSDLARIAIEE